MKEEKAYKLLAIQEDISNRQAKELIDKGLVYAGGRKVLIARANIKTDTTFKVEKIQDSKIIFEDELMLVLDKPPFLLTDDLSIKYGYAPLHRLDKETSGVLVLTKDEAFRQKAINEFKNKNVEKIYFAIVYGKIAEPLTIDAPLITQKKKGIAYTKISKHGKEALSLVEPMMIQGKHSLVKVEIKTGRTHQIRVHLQSIGHPIVGDTKYGGNNAKRVMLHSQKLTLLGKTFTSSLPKEFNRYGFKELP